MRADRLLRLYPRAWRERYGDEFAAVTGDAPLTLQQVIDIVSGVIDAWLSADVKAATSGGGSMTMRSVFVCQRSQTRYTTRDGLVGAAVMIGVTAAFSALGLALKYSGWTVASQVVLNVAFMGSMMISLPFWLMKGQPWKAQTVIVGGTLALLFAIAYLAAVI